MIKSVKHDIGLHIFLNSTVTICSTMHGFDGTYIIWFLTWHNESINDDENVVLHILTLVSHSFSLCSTDDFNSGCWWCHGCIMQCNNEDVCLQKVISYSLFFSFRAIFILFDAQRQGAICCRLVKWYVIQVFSLVVTQNIFHDDWILMLYIVHLVNISPEMIIWWQIWLSEDYYNEMVPEVPSSL